MAKKNNIVRYSMEEIKAKIARGEDQTSWAKIASMTEAELEASIAADPDEAGMEMDWSKAMIGMPRPKTMVNLRIDPHILEFFKKSGRGYQTRINAVLKAFVEAQEHAHEKNH